MPACYYNCSSLVPIFYNWYAWSRQTHNHQACTAHLLVVAAEGASMSSGGYQRHCPLMVVNIDRVFAWLTQIAVAMMQALGIGVQIPALQPDAFPFWNSAMAVLSIVAIILVMRKYVENWLLWVVSDVIIIAIFAYRGVYAMALEYIILTLIALNSSWL